MAYCLALKEGLAGLFGIQMLIFGDEGSGKTSLVATLLGEDHENTKGMNTKFCMIQTSNWHRCSPQDLVNKLQNHYWYHLNACADEHADLASLQDQCFSSSSYGVVNKDEIEEAKRFKSKLTQLPKYFSEEEFCGVIYDFSGHLAINSIFIQRNSVVAIVFKASSDLPVIVNKVHYWLQYVYSVGRDTVGDQYSSELLPTVVLVATHVDEIAKDVAEVIQAITDQLVKELKGKPYAKHLAGYQLGIKNALSKYCFFISNKDKEKAKVATQIREALSEIFHPVFNQKHPLIYLKIEKELCALQKKIISTTDFHRIATNNGLSCEVESKEVKAAIKYFHDKGTILHFQSIPRLKNVTFLSPWILAEFLTYLTAECQCSSPKTSKHNILDEGSLHGKLFISQTIKAFNADFGYNISLEEMVDFLVKLGFVTEVKFCEKSNSEQKKEEFFVIPSVMPARKQECAKRESEFHWCICFTFPDGFLSPTVFHQIVSKCVNWNQSRNEGILKYETIVFIKNLFVQMLF